MFKRMTTTGAALLLIVGCVDTPTNPTDVSPVFAKGGVAQSATGSGSFTDGLGDPRTFSFTARLNADGSVGGQWERVNHRGNASQTKSHGVVTCLTIVNNEAWIGGHATSGVASEPPNNDVFWRVVDNGQGRNAPADQISLQGVNRVPGTAAAYCATTPAQSLNDVVAGNIQVRD